MIAFMVRSISSREAKYLRERMRLDSLHCVSIGLSCGVYGGRNISRMRLLWNR